MGAWIFLFLSLLTCAGLRPSFSDPNDEACLTHLSQSIQDPAKSLHNWTKSTFSNPCNGFTSYLQGATCNNGRIYKLSLTNLSLRGSISPFLANCTNLQALDLSSNFLTGSIPSDLQSLVNLANYYTARYAEDSTNSNHTSFTGVCIWLKITEQKMVLEEGKISQLMPDY